jgi:F-type H+-transporting ATPase subunit delta
VAEVNEGEDAAAAERYAQAAFELGLEANALAALDADLARMAAAFAESADLRAAAASPLIDPQDKAKALVAVAEKLGLSALGRNVVGAAAQNRRAAALPQIARAFARKYARHRGAERAEIISAAPLSDAQAKAITAALSAATKTTIEPELRVDASLIGGFVARVGSRQFDASLKTKLASLRAALKAS